MGEGEATWPATSVSLISGEHDAVLIDAALTPEEPWDEAGQQWRRHRVTWPSHLATHSSAQTLYFDRDGLLARHDYEVEISGGTPAAHYVSDYDDVAGIRLPTKHRIFPRTPDGESLAEPLVVSIDLSEIAFT
jgi:hypothetical protein